VEVTAIHNIPACGNATFLHGMWAAGDNVKMAKTIHDTWR